MTVPGPVTLRRVRTLTLGGRQPGALSAASGLVLAGATAYVVADDEHHLGVFPLDTADPGVGVRLLPGVLPAGHAARKRRKPDFEVLAGLNGPGGPAMLAMGSGSTPRRERAVVVALDPAGVPRPVAVLGFGGLYGPLRHAFGDVNVEAAVVGATEVTIVSRAHGGSPVNGIARYGRDRVDAWLDRGARGALRPDTLGELSLPGPEGVPLGITDAAAHPDGGWVFCAVGEATDNSYADGALVASAVGRVDEDGRAVGVVPVAPLVKLEGVAVVGADAAGTGLLLVTDADDRSVPAELLAGRLPAAP